MEVAVRERVSCSCTYRAAFLLPEANFDEVHFVRFWCDIMR